MRKRSSLIGLLVFTIFGMFLAVFPRDTQAIPYFARKYETSCQTCHVQFPKLTPFGSAFRRVGYRFPEGNDINFAKQPQLEMGAPAWKKLFPKAVWPGELPGTIPISVSFENEFKYTPRKGAHSDFTVFGGEAEIISSGTLGEALSWFGAVEFESKNLTGEAKVKLPRFFGIFKPFDKPLFMARIGRFDPTILSWGNKRILNSSIWMLTQNPRRFMDTDRASGATLESNPAQQGIELTGILGKGRFLYAAGVVEGNSDIAATVRNDAKDVYGSLHYKFGGMRIDGVEEEAGGVTSSTEAPFPWRERSLTIGGFWYDGKSKIVAANEDANSGFYKFGVDANLIYNDFNLMAAGSFEKHRNAFADTIAADNIFLENLSKIRARKDLNVTQWFAQVDYVVFPWLVPSVKYDWLHVGSDSSQAKLTLDLNFLIRANAKAVFRAEFIDGRTTDLTNARTVANGDSGTGGARGMRTEEIELVVEFVF